MNTMHDAGQACNTIAVAPTLAEQLAAAESDEGNVPTEDSPLAHVLAYALGAEDGGLVAALIQTAEDAACMLPGAEQHHGLGGELVKVIHRSLVAARLLHGAERTALQQAAKASP